MPRVRTLQASSSTTVSVEMGLETGLPPVASDPTRQGGFLSKGNECKTAAKDPRAEHWVCLGEQNF